MPFMEITLLNDGWVIRPCGIDDLEEVSKLVLQEARRSIIEDFDEAGWEDFQDYLSSEQLLYRLSTGSKGLVLQGEDDRLAGYVEVSGNQILLFFVSEKAQGLNLATRLFEKLCEGLALKELYVNASSRGHAFYLKQGFKELGEWQTTAGVRYCPMSWSS
ncbi:GNAT family N-acetyltransferase [Kiloniella laminariae]|uniref:GNAT family N-acetyltransferase n=1 Tax=Kiloniella laminariae TaxID=454162 RepID=A0ABT4LNJ7_9PROT|nr:GNAT family N-acetyltransferase [Kiloniella laminariae]MCZ4282465.1 GNAT family N-acetyltransferase [Kiloniella laminariae]